MRDLIFYYLELMVTLDDLKEKAFICHKLALNEKDKAEFGKELNEIASVQRGCLGAVKYFLSILCGKDAILN